MKKKYMMELNKYELNKYKFKLNTFAYFLILLLIIIIKSRISNVLNPQFFAEDGTIFFSQQYGHLLPQLFIPYAGYLHFLIRLVAYFASFFDTLYAPLIYEGAAIIISTAIMTYFIKKSLHIFNPIMIIFSFAFAITNGEEFGSITYILWFCQILLFILIIYPSSANEKLVQRVLNLSLILILALTGPFSLFLSLILILIYLVSLMKPSKTILRDIFSIKQHIRLSRVICLFIGTFIQCFYIFYFSHYFPSNPSRIHFDLAHLLNLLKIISYGLEFRLFGYTLFPLIFPIFLFIFLLISLSNKSLTSEQRGIIILFLLFSFFGIISVSFAGNVWDMNTMKSFGGDRYFFLFKMLFWVLFPLFLNSISPFFTTKKSLYLSIFFLILIAAMNHFNISRWKFDNYDWKIENSVIKNNITSVKVPINPPGWYIEINKNNWKTISNNLHLVNNPTSYTIESITLNNRKPLCSLLYTTKTALSGNMSLPLLNNQKVEIVLPDGIPQGIINQVSILQGNYCNTANGILKVKVCSNNNCSQGERPLSQSKDNSFFAIPLAIPLNNPKGKVILTIEHINSTKPVAIWLYPSLNDFPQIIKTNRKEINNKAAQISFNYEPPSKLEIPINSGSSDNSIQISGWAVDSIAKNADSGVIAVIDNKYFYPLQNGIQRLDVSSAFNNPNYEYSGFSGSIPFSRLDFGTHTLTLRIINNKKTGYYESSPIKLFIENSLK